MLLFVEISMYPLKEAYIGPIQTFIDRLNSHPSLDVATNATATHVSGEYAEVMQILGQEMQRIHEEIGQSIFVCKFLNGDKMGKRAGE
ncbi:hypothetical protein LJ739_10570 [Aestuariibacter halophilus]|uniref:Thiamin/hydroxymethyl pyrimidine-binding YkoF putative domain-containing protein n=1 Tax=Fluctibacter halophilus TaxID=226011 RepID=A0ABS8G822_9ALTE|nr:hypothetical protein [Aestuariibacter halophilus]MCC2616685.1 hypothetical protein [Aestuariibacter halophilus]